MTRPNIPAFLRDDVLVVFEGPRRLLWKQRGPLQWVPYAVWPSAEDRAALLRRRAGGDPILVVIEDAPARIPILAEERSSAPAELRERMRPTGDDLYELEIPLADWLPEPLQQRAQTLAERARQVRDTSPAALLPPFLFETRSDVSDDPLKFVHRLGAGHCSHQALAALAAYAHSHIRGYSSSDDAGRQVLV
ncbi:MAG: hypothetical protein K6T28_02500 [Acidothermus sp.]|nr:hypothetical protein [Acidothermus sp.]